MKLKKGLIQIYTGDGKGKTTAAIGAAIRAAGAGLSVVFFQFLKYGKFQNNDGKILKKIKKIRFIKFKEKSPLFSKISPEKLKQQIQKDMAIVWQTIFSKKYDLVILDEFTYLLNMKLLDLDLFLEKIKQKPKNMEIIITGRNAPKEIIKIASLVTFMKKIKHSFDKKICARKGIEF